MYYLLYTAADKALQNRQQRMVLLPKRLHLEEALERVPPPFQTILLHSMATYVFKHITFNSSAQNGVTAWMMMMLDNVLPFGAGLFFRRQHNSVPCSISYLQRIENQNFIPLMNIQIFFHLQNIASLFSLVLSFQTLVREPDTIQMVSIQHINGTARIFSS